MTEIKREEYVNCEPYWTVYRDSSGWFYIEGEDRGEKIHGCSKTLDSLINVDVLGFCGCADPETNVYLVRDGLSLIAQLRQSWWGLDDTMEQRLTKQQATRELEEKLTQLFGNEASKQFFYYWAHSKGYTDHGSSIPGWLTERGEALLKLLNVVNPSNTREPED